MKQIIVLSLIGFILVAANVNHEIKVSTADDGLDSVRCSCFTAQAGVNPPTSVATFKLLVFPNDTFVTIPDTGNVKVQCLWYFTGETGYRLSSEIVPENVWPSPTFPANFADLSITSGTGRVAVGTNFDKAGYALAAGQFTKIKDTLNEALDNDTTLLAFLRLAASGAGGGEVWTRPEVDSIIARMLALRDSAAQIHAEVVNVDGKVPLTPSDTASLVVNIANQVHNEDTIGHLAALGDPGKMPYHYSRTGAGGGGGSGCGDSLGYTRTLVLIDTSAVPDVVLNGIDIYFNNQPQSGEPYRITTNNLGRGSLGLNAGNWVRLHTDARYLPDTDSFTVAGAGIDTMRLCEVVLVDTDTLTTTVIFYIKKPNGTPNDSAHITIELFPYNQDTMLYINNVIIDASYAEWPLRGNSSGIASTHLYGNALFLNDSSYYQATVRNRFNAKIIDAYKFRVPVSDSVVYAHLLPRWKE